MARKFFKYPPRPSSGAGTFSDNIVGFQIVDGGGLTQGNFEFSTNLVEKVNRQFNVGAFSDPISLENLNTTIDESREIAAKELRVYPNFDLSEITRFNLYGSLTKRVAASVEKIINYFPAALEIYSLNSDFTTGFTATNCVFNPIENTTEFDINISKIVNPFGIDYSINSSRNLINREKKVSELRDLSLNYPKYSLFISDLEYTILYLEPSESLFSGVLNIIVSGNPFSGLGNSTNTLVIRPNSFYTDKSFIEPFDEVEQFLLNRLVVPKYTASFKVPKESDDGTIYVDFDKITWPIDGVWNIDIRSFGFDNYLLKLNEITSSFDSFRTNLVTRFLTTESFKEFDTEEQNVQKILSIYGRQFDEVKKFIDALSHITSVNYTVKNDIPSQLLKNLAETIGWKINISPITNENFLNSVFSTNNKIQYPGYSRASTPNELNYQFYRNLILNAAYLFKSKGTRKSIEFLLRLVGAPEALVEFNEHIYIAGQRINMDEFDRKFIDISDGIYIQEDPVYSNNPSDVFLFADGNVYTGYSTQQTFIAADVVREDYPIDDFGFPKAPPDTANFYFQKGAGWFELVKDHQSPQQINTTSSVFTGQNFNIQTEFEPFTYGQKYLDRFRNFPYISEGFRLIRTPDNRKSWPSSDVGLRIGNGNAKYDAYYFINNDKLVLNVKNVDLFLNPAQGLAYDVWYMSRKYDFPIPASGLTSPYPTPGGIDWTVIKPQPTKQSFFEFAQTFWTNTINVRNRLFISDGKTGGYPTLQSIYYRYLESLERVGIPNDNFTYRSMIDYVSGLGNHWVRLVEQMIPATTIWMTGVKYENSIFHRQKFVYRLQRGCQIVPLPCDPCSLTNSLFPGNCNDNTFSCSIVPTTDFSTLLGQTISTFESSNNLSCNSNTITTDWFLEVKIDNQIVLKQKFFEGIATDVPTYLDWKNSILNNLGVLNNYGIDYLINGDTIYISNSGCDDLFVNKPVELNVDLDFEISCS